MGDADPSMGSDLPAIRTSLPSWRWSGVGEMFQQEQHRQCLQCTPSLNEKATVCLPRH